MLLKQSTAITVKIGPFVDSTNGNTVEDGLTISQGDVRLSKNGGNIAQKNESTACTHDEIGIYDCPLDTTDTGTLGRLQLFVHESGSLPVWHEFMVVPANVWDSLCGADYLQTHAVEIANDLITAAAVADGAIDAGALGADCITSAKIADNAIAAEHLAANAIDFATFAADCKTGSGLKANVESISANAITATAIAADAITEAKIADNAIAAEHIAANAIDAATFAADVDAEIRTYVWNAGTADYGGAGTYGQAVEDILVDTSTTLQGELDGIQADTEDLQTQIGAAGAGLTAVPWNAAWDAQVQSEVFDALNDAFTDATSLTANGLLDRIRTLMWIQRNKMTVDDSDGEVTVFKDDNSTTAFNVAAALTDDSETTTRLRIA
jgi:hypothetical protein